MKKENVRTLLTETSVSDTSKQLLSDALTESRTTRDQALNNAKKAIEEAFGPAVDKLLKNDLLDPQNLLKEETFTAEDLEVVISQVEKEINGEDPTIDEYRQRLNETKNSNVPLCDKDKMYRDIHRSFWAYIESLPRRTAGEALKPHSPEDAATRKFFENRGKPGLRWISYEGSIVICTLLSVSNGSTDVSMTQLPVADRKVVNEFISNITGENYVFENKVLNVKFDEFKNFDVRCSVDGKDVEFTLGNRVVSIPPNEQIRFGNSPEIKVERKGKDIMIGDRIKFDPSRAQTLAQTHGSNNGQHPRRDSYPQKQKVSGRNAYEIRQDIIDNAIEVVRLSSITQRMDCNAVTEDVLAIAERLYEFVEHKK